MTATMTYQGNLRCEVTHLQSGTRIETDAPTDNRGKGERFSPTDLVCTALASCMITTMALKAAEMDIELAGTTAQITKHMLSDPRRIGKIEVTLQFPPNLVMNDKDRTILERTGNHCPVVKSLHPDLELVISYK